MSEHRKICAECRFWSEMCAQSSGFGPMQAICLAPESPMAYKYTIESFSCSEWKSNHHGAVDSPPNFGERAREAYDAEAAVMQKYK